MPDLHSPLRSGNINLKNRLVMPPMILIKSMDASWEPDDDHLEHYARRAKNGFGLIIVEATTTAPDGRLLPFQLRAWDNAHIPHLSRLAAAVKKYGATAMIQIHHAGANTTRGILDGARPVSPSGIPTERSRADDPRALSPGEIEALIESFAAAARRCLAAGFDGVEIHGAHGYLLSQFLSPAFNKRTDAWGGPTIQERLAFPLAVVKAVRAAVGPRALVGYRLGAAESIPDGLTLADGKAAARALVGTGRLDLLSVSNGMDGGQEPTPPADFGFGYLMWLGSEIKKEVSLPVIGVGGIRTGAEADEVLRRGLVDLVAVGRAALVDPDWAKKALAGRDDEIRPCLQCRRCARFLPRRRCPGETQKS